MPGAALEAAAVMKHATSRFAQQVSWDTPAEDSYGDQYLAMCLAIKVRALELSCFMISADRSSSS